MQVVISSELELLHRFLKGFDLNSENILEVASAVLDVSDGLLTMSISFLYVASFANLSASSFPRFPVWLLIQ
ncbi:hypothetical protein CEXT_238831 [Caerostris extrusa]|uniref:Uncharacterized protein n=1 Tax=Caerostris extrusa TaxID=172846 RepID=A0AAV4SKR7_CAEEX|nr:hypothetical protein CEXT_238831 [Caerostris extrusa]